MGDVARRTVQRASPLLSATQVIVSRGRESGQREQPPPKPSLSFSVWEDALWELLERGSRNCNWVVTQPTHLSGNSTKGEIISLQ